MPLPEVKVGQHSAVISGDSLELIVHRGGLVKMAAERSTHDGELRNTDKHAK